MNQFQFKRNNNDKSVDFPISLKKIMGGRKHSLIVVGPGQRQGPLVSFHNTYRFLKHNTYRFCIKSQKYIYCAHTGVDPDMSTMGDTLCRHSNHSSRANISQTASVE